MIDQRLYGLNEAIEAGAEDLVIADPCSPGRRAPPTRDPSSPTQTPAKSNHGYRNCDDCCYRCDNACNGTSLLPREPQSYLVPESERGIS